ncbi:MAG: RNA polymerase sigma factor [Nitrospiraceae bacterium]
MARSALTLPEIGSTDGQSDGHERLSFDDLYREHVDRIFRYAQRLCGEPEAAKDVVQDTFLNAYRGYKDFRGESQVSTWLYTIASRVCQRLRRKRKGQPERELSLEDFIPTTDGELRLQIPVEGLTPEEALVNKQLRRALDQAIGRLPPKYRMVLVLRDMEGISAREVGAVMGLNERAVKSRLHRARLFVRRELSARGVGTPLTPGHRHKHTEELDSGIM